jgi:hypothetical protein
MNNKHLPFLTLILLALSGCFQTYQIADPTKADTTTDNDFVYDSRTGKIYYADSLDKSGWGSYSGPQETRSWNANDLGINTRVLDSIIPGAAISKPITYKISGQITLTPVGIDVPTDTLPDPPDPIDTTDVPVITIGDAQKMGACVFPWTGLQRMKDLGITKVRVYCPVHWFYTEKGFYGEPFYQAWTNEAPGIDTYLAKAKELGIEVIFCANQTPEWLRKTGNGNGGNDFPPIKQGLDRRDPRNYAEIARVFRDLAWRYGSVRNDTVTLRIDTTPQYANQPKNVRKTGLGLLKKIEVQNELDHWFEGFAHEKYMKADEQAALLVAVVKAIRSADPSMEIYMGGITDLNLWYLKDMYAAFVKLWPEGAKYFPHVNVHHYSNILNKPGTDKPTWAMSGGCWPENDPAFSQINDIVSWTKSLPVEAGKRRKCVVTEFGYDKRPPSMMHIKGNGISDEEAQGIGIVKTYRAYMAAGVDEAYVYEAADQEHAGQFASCGLMTSQFKGFVPGPSYFAVKSLIRELSVPGAMAYIPPDLGNAPPGTLKSGQMVKVGDMKKAAKKFPLPKKR